MSSDLNTFAEEDRWNVLAATNLFKKGLICDR